MPKRNTSPKKSKAKSRKVEYDEEDISSKHKSEEEVSKIDADDDINKTLENLSEELPAPESGWGTLGTFLICGLTNWELSGRNKCLNNSKPSSGRNLWTPHILKNLNGTRIRLIVSGPTAAHSVIVTEDYRCLVFGRNEQGQLGLGDTERRDEPTEIKALKSHKIIGAACSSKHTLFLTNRGQVYATGSNNYGQCGIGKNSPQILTVQKVKYSGPPIVKVGCGDQFSIILDNKGGLHSFGCHQYGVLGHNTNGEYFITISKIDFRFEKSPKRINKYIQKTREGQFSYDDVKITDFSCGINHTVAIDSEGRAFSWGFGGYGRLGHNEQQDELIPRSIRFLEPPKSGVRAVYCGSTYTIVIIVNNVVMMFGKTKQYGEVNMYPKPIQELFNWDVRCVGVAKTSVVAAAENSVFAWGASPTYGELGIGDSPKSSTTPIKVEALEGLYIKAITCGISHTMMICRDESKEEKEKIKQLNVYSA